MKHERWEEQLEAYLSGELDEEARESFETETAANPEWKAALASRQAFSLAARAALRDEPAADLQELAVRSLRAGRVAGRRQAAPRRRIWISLAAAVLVLAAFLPVLLRNFDGAAGPRSSITRSGQLVAVRFGEMPGETVRYEAGCFDQSYGTCR